MSPALLAAFGLAVTIPVGAAGCGAALLADRLTASPRWREAAWRAVTTAMVIAGLAGPLLVAVAPMSSVSKVEASAPQARVAAQGRPILPRPPRLSDNWATPVSEVFLLLAGAGTVIALGGLASGYRRVSRWVAASECLENPHLATQVGVWAERLGVVAPAILISSQAPMAFLKGPLAQRIVLPSALVAELSPQSLELICAHELAHLKRGDPGRVLTERLLAAVLWFNPFAHLALSRLAAARETACDDLVLRDANPAARRLYAQTLLSALRLSAGPAPQPALIRHEGNHTMRFDAVLHPPLPPRRAAVAALTLLLTVGIASAATVVAAAATELQAVAKGASKPVASQSTTKSDITITADSVWTDHGHTIYVGSPTLRIAGQYPTRVKVDGRPVVGDLDYHSGQIKRVELWQRSSPQVAAHGGDAQHDVIEVTLTR